MTTREGAVISAYTGILVCNDFSPVHEYIEEIIGRPVFTHEIPSLETEIKEKSKAEFERIVNNIGRDERRDAVFRRCICDYGNNPQIDMAIEEMSELTKALLKWRRAEGAELAAARNCIVDELADVRIMARQMEILFQCEDEVERRIDFKVQRQADRLDKWEAEHGEN